MILLPPKSIPTDTLFPSTTRFRSIGGVARADEGLLPARLLMGEHVRVGSSAAILSRTFHRQLESVEAIQREMNFAEEVKLLEDIEGGYQLASSEDRKSTRLNSSH